MSNISSFESRSGRLKCPADDLFNFVVDMRNFEQFVSGGTIENWQANKESCSFTVAMLGSVSFRLTDKEMFNKVLYAGDALKKDDFSISLNIADNGTDPADFRVKLDIDLNPMFKMMAVKPIERFLEGLVSKMEGFSGWKETKGYNQLP